MQRENQDGLQLYRQCGHKIPNYLGESIRFQLLQRADNQNGLEECLAIALGSVTFNISHSLMLSFIDDDSVIGEVNFGTCCMCVALYGSKTHCFGMCP